MKNGDHLQMGFTKSIVMHNRKYGGWGCIIRDHNGAFYGSCCRAFVISFKPLFSFCKLLKSALCIKKILRHIKLAVHVWGTKCRRNKKLIAQFALTLRDESFEPN